MTPYALKPDVARRRALAGAFAGAIAAVGPVVLGLVLLFRLGVQIESRLWIGVVSALGVLAIVRTIVAFGRMRKELASLRVKIDDAGIDVQTRRRLHRIPKSAVSSILEFPGSLGGLRLELEEKWDGSDQSPAYFDIPRGGDNFGELRTTLEAWKPVETPKRRGRVFRLVLGIAIVLGLFFVPFLIADLGRSPMLAAAVVLLGWFAMRVALRR